MNSELAVPQGVSRKWITQCVNRMKNVEVYPVKCSFCDYRTTTKYLRQLHERRHHKEEYHNARERASALKATQKEERRLEKVVANEARTNKTASITNIIDVENTEKMIVYYAEEIVEYSRTGNKKLFPERIRKRLYKHGYLSYEGGYSKRTLSKKARDIITAVPANSESK